MVPLKVIQPSTRCDRMTQFHSAAIGQSSKPLTRLSLLFLTSYVASNADLHGLNALYTQRFLAQRFGHRANSLVR